MRRRDHDAADGRAIAGMSVGVQNEIANAGREARINGLLKASRIKAGANGVGANHSDRRSPIDRQEADRVVCSYNMGIGCVFAHYYLPRSTRQTFAET